MYSGARRFIVIGTALSLIGVVPAWADRAAPRAPAHPRQTHSLSGKTQPRGRLSVSVKGTGSYAIKGRGTCEVGAKSESYRLAPGKYRVVAAGARVRPGGAVVRAGQRKLVRVSFRRQTPPGTVTRVSADAAGTPANDQSDGFAVWSPDGSRIAFISGASNLVRGPGRGGLFVKTLATGRVDRVVSFTPELRGFDLAGNLAWSPDGTRIAFNTEASKIVPEDTNGRDDVFVVSLTTGEVLRASVDSQGRQTRSGVDSYHPDWSPDGSRLTFVSDQLDPKDDDSWQSIYVKDLTTGAVQLFSPQGRYNASAPAWSPDGRQIAWQASGTGIMVQDLGEGNVRVAVADRDAGTPVWSPDGTRIAYDSALEDIFVTNLASGQRDKVSFAGEPGTGSYVPAWSPDGSSILFISTAGPTPGSALYVRNLATGRLVEVSTNSSGKRVNNGSGPGSWSPDGKQIVFTSSATNYVPCDTQSNTEVFVKRLS